MAHLGECLHSTYEAVGLIPSTNKTVIPSTWEVEGENQRSKVIPDYTASSGPFCAT